MERYCVSRCATNTSHTQAMHLSSFAGPFSGAGNKVVAFIQQGNVQEALASFTDNPDDAGASSLISYYGMCIALTLHSTLTHTANPHPHPTHAPTTHH